jgi:hypothetical protein
MVFSHLCRGVRPGCHPLLIGVERRCTAHAAPNNEANSAVPSGVALSKNIPYAVFSETPIYGRLVGR